MGCVLAKRFNDFAALRLIVGAGDTAAGHPLRWPFSCPQNYHNLSTEFPQVVHSGPSQKCYTIRVVLTHKVKRHDTENHYRRTP